MKNAYIIGVMLLAVGGFACGGSQKSDSSTTATDTANRGGSGDAAEGSAASKNSSDAGEFQVSNADKSSRPAQAKLKATKTETAVRFIVVDKDKGPIKGIVVSLTSPKGDKYYTKETDADGFAEVLVPAGQTYELVYLSLGRRDISAKVPVPNEPYQNLKLTMRYKREDYAPAPPAAVEPADAPAPRFVLKGVQFASGKATLDPESFSRLDSIVEYMTHKTSVRIEISGHTDNVGNKKANKVLSQKRADSVRAYLVSKGVDVARIDSVGYGDERPMKSNDTAEGRQENRRIEVTEL